MTLETMDVFGVRILRGEVEVAVDILRHRCRLGQGSRNPRRLGQRRMELVDVVGARPLSEMPYRLIEAFCFESGMDVWPADCRS